MVNKFRLDRATNTQTKEVISRTLEIANQYAGELTVEVLPLDKIELDPENNRELVLTLQDALNGIHPDDPAYDKKKQDWRSLESLAKTIRDDQLINPIFVYRYGNKCRLIAGERRTLASAIAGKKEIIARITSVRPVGTKLKILQWIENNERVDLTLAERIASLEAMLKEYFSENKQKNAERVTAKLLSDLTGMSITQSRRYVLILQAKPEIKKAINEGKLENIKIIELLCNTENIEHQSILLKAVLEEASFETVIRLKKELEIIGKSKKDLRGRKKFNVRLGNVKPNVAKIIFDALVTVNHLNQALKSELNIIHGAIEWSNVKSLEQSFKKLVDVLEREVKLS